MTDRTVPRDPFLEPSCHPRTLDLYHARSAILRAFDEVLPSMEGRLLDLGCGQMPYRSLVEERARAVRAYVGLDLVDPSAPRGDVTPDLVWDGSVVPAEADSFEWAMATEVLEHCPDRGVVMREVFRVLRPGGRFFATVPFLWPLHEVPHDEARPTPFALRRELEQAGFEVERIESLGGWDQSLAQMLGLWVRRRPMRSAYRRVLAIAAAPLVRFLSARPWDHSRFDESQMLTGCWFLARKPAETPADATGREG